MESKTSFLISKVSLPVVPVQWVHRERLIDQLDRLHSARVILVSSPPGYGKTALISAWFQQLAGKRTAWLGLDPADNDPVRFWSYGIIALRSAQGQGEPAFGQFFLEWVRAPEMPPLENALVALLNEISTWPVELWLALDDYQVIANETIHEQLRFLIENLPANLHLVILTRSEPSFVQARYRVRGWLSEIGPTDLCFDHAEIIEFMRRTMRLELTPGEVAALEERTEGWVAGLQMAALALQANRTSAAEDRQGLIAGFSGTDRFVMDYFTQEVLARLPQDLGGFLRKTALLDRFNAELCLAVTEKEDSQALIDRLEQANLFLIPLDHSRGWYRYHPLFADLLRRLYRQEDAPAVDACHRKAALWLAAHGWPEDALEHAFSSGDLAMAGDLMENLVIDWMMRGEVHTLQRGLARFPRDFTLASPLLCLGHAWALLYQAHFGQAGAWAGRAQAALPAAPSLKYPADYYQGQVDLIRATVAINQQDVALAIQLTRRAIPSIPREYTHMLSLAYLNLGDASDARGEYEEAEQAYVEAYQSAHDSGSRILEVVIIGSLGHLYLRRGNLRQAEQILSQALLVEKDAGASGGGNLFTVGKPLAFLAMIYLERNQLDLALDTARHALDECQRWGHLQHQLDCYLCLAQIQTAYRDRAAAQAELSQARGLLEHLPASRVPLEVQRNWASAFRQRIQQAEMAVSLALGSRMEIEQGVSRWQSSEMQAQDEGNVPSGLLAWSWLRIGMPERAIPILKRWREQAGARRLLNDQVEALVLLSRAYQAVGENQQASTCLSEAVSLGEGAGFVRTFLVGGSEVRKLLARLQETAGPSRQDYLRSLLFAFHEAEEENNRPEEKQSTGITLSEEVGAQEIEPLTGRELEILGLLSADLTYPEIAAHLYLSVNTVKTHVKRLYGKLGIASRMAAVERGRQLGLIRPRSH